MVAHARSVYAVLDGRELQKRTAEDNKKRELQKRAIQQTQPGTQAPSSGTQVTRSGLKASTAVAAGEPVARLRTACGALDVRHVAQPLPAACKFSATGAGHAIGHPAGVPAGRLGGHREARVQSLALGIGHVACTLAGGVRCTLANGSWAKSKA